MKKKRFLGILLSLVMVLGLMPGMSLTAYADDPYANLKNTTTVIKFDSKDWYLIDYDETTVTLLSKECVGASPYNSSDTYVEYASSIIKTAVDSWYSSNIAADAKTAVNGNGMFILTNQQAQTIFYANADVLKCSQATGAQYDFWWLCSVGYADYNATFVDGFSGYVDFPGMNVGYQLGVRPALKLNLSSVSFDSKSNTFSVRHSGSQPSAGDQPSNESSTEKPAPVIVQEPITISKTPASVKAKVKKNKVTVSWKKIKKNKAGKKLLAQIKSIQVQYSADPKFEQNPVTKSVGKGKAKIVLKLNKETTYYVRVRYVGKDGYSNWTKPKKVKTKK